MPVYKQLKGGVHIADSGLPSGPGERFTSVHKLDVLFPKRFELLMDLPGDPPKGAIEEPPTTDPPFVKPKPPWWPADRPWPPVPPGQGAPGRSSNPWHPAADLWGWPLRRRRV
jgi:hypothetical protein